MSRLKPTRLTPDQAKAFSQALVTDSSNYRREQCPELLQDTEPLELVYNIRQKTFRLAPASTLLAPQVPPRYLLATARDVVETPSTLLSPTILAPALRRKSDAEKYEQECKSRRTLYGPRKLMKGRTPSQSRSVSSSSSHSRPGSAPAPAPNVGIEGHSFLEVPGNIPPVLIDGRMMIVQVPRWKLKVDFCWSSFNGQKTTVWVREVKLPWWVWVQRNVRGRWAEMWIERS